MGTAMCDCGPLLFKQHVKPKRSQWWKSSTMRAWTSCQKEFEAWDVWNHQLVGGLEHFLYMFFPFHVWDVILPIDFHIVQRGWNHHPVKILEVRDVRIDGLPLVLAFLSSKGTPGCTLLFHQNINQKWSINLLMIATFLRCLASPGRRKKARTQRGTPPWSTMAMDNHPREKGRSYAWRHVDIDR